MKGAWTAPRGPRTNTTITTPAKAVIAPLFVGWGLPSFAGVGSSFPTMSADTPEIDPDVELNDEQRDRLAAEPAPNAAVCGRIGCSASDDLLRADHPTKPERRVVCRDHLDDLWGLSS